VCAVLSFLAFKFFFVPPIFTLTVDDTRDVLHLLVFLVTALIGGGMAVRVREQALAAQHLANETTALYDLSQAISTELEFDRIAPLIIDTTLRILPCRACYLYLLAAGGSLSEVAQGGQWHASASLAEAALYSGSQTIGVLRVALAPGQAPLDAGRQRLLNTLAGQAALAVERSRLAQAAARAEALAESDRLKSTLLSAVSHDFRTPLAAITAAVDELVAEDVHWSSEARQGFSRLIRTEAERLNRLVMNLLDLTRLEAGVLHPQRGWYNIAEIVNAVLQRLTPDLADRRLELEVPDDLPLLPVDYVQLEQVLWNLIQNALKYSPPDSPLTITAALEQDVLLLSIGDRGAGIPIAERTRVFERFYRFQPPDQARVPGAGVGLTICKGLIEAHGGQIAIQGRDGGGTLIQIRLPLEVDEPARLAEVQR
jgi:two-component system sensor histidine kinase KdpD